MADQGGTTGTAMRDYRKGNWTLTETMVLIEAKKMDDERRMKRSSDSGGEGRSKPAELRWKWVEDYCWRKGCLRSQNQCNDKWDNLMRDYKRVRDYERRVAERSSGAGSSTSDHEGLLSYWKLEKNERKEKNLPSNMLPQIYEALVGVVEKRGVGSHHHHNTMPMMSTTTTGDGSCSNPNISYVVEGSISTSTALPPIVQQQVVSAPIPVALPLSPPQLPLPPLPPAAQPLPPALPYSQPLPTTSDGSDSDTSQYTDSPAKRRRRSGSGRGGGGGGGEGTSGGATASASTSNGVGTAISKSASIIAEALHASEEREERRHKDLMSLHERRLRIEESKAEISRQGINGLVDAINNLANSILALASHKNQSSAPK